MIKVQDIKVYNFDGAIRGLRNPLNSWSKSDSKFVKISEEADTNTLHQYMSVNTELDEYIYKIGPNDLALMQKLSKAGTEHRKYLRQIFVSMDVTAPLYWWKEFDTYKVGTVANSCSTMHKLMAKEFEPSDFSFEHVPAEAFESIISDLNDVRDTYLNYEKLTADGDIMQGLSKKDVWYCLIQMLPEAYNQKRTVTMNYENIFTIIKQRTGHKLDEWNEFVEILKTLPYIREIGEFES